MTTTLAKQFRTKLEAYQKYVQACDDFVGALEEVEHAVESFGSDPLGVLEVFKPKDLTTDVQRVTPEAEAEHKRLQRLRKQGVTVTQITPAEALTDIPVQRLPDQQDVIRAWQRQKKQERKLDKEIADLKPEPKKFRRPSDQARVETNVQWLYEQLLGGPVAGNQLKINAKKAGISEHGLQTARRHVDDILLKTVGFRGQQYWYIKGDEHKLPSVKDPREVEREFLRNGKELNGNDKKVLSAITTQGVSIAEVIGVTKLSPSRVKESLTRLRAIKYIVPSKKSGHGHKWIKTLEGATAPV